MNLNRADDSKQLVAFFRQAMLVLCFILCSRMIAMYVMPLNDSTEARYGEIARIMLETGNWITPMQSYGVPFWAKPPLSTWLSTASMALFGVNEFAVRLPGLLLSIGILCLIWDVAKKRSGLPVAILSVLVLASCIYFVIDAGTVMTDPALLFCITLTFVAFWHAVVWQHSRWGYWFFVALGLGLLAKGPIVLILTSVPIFIWVLKQKKWFDLWHYLPWIKGGLLMLVIACPWYILAESRTPGFIHYFVVGEHINRFLQPGWQGDKYGFAHVTPYGMIWVYALLGLLPWSIPAIVWLTGHRKEIPALCQDNDGWVSYLLLCTIVPLVFFTFARNIIYPYVFPSLPTFALMFAELAHRSQANIKNPQRYIVCAAVPGLVFLLVTAVFIAKPEWVAKSQNRVVATVVKQHPTADSQLIYWLSKSDYSAQFYSAGRVKATLDTHELCTLLANHARHYVVLASYEQHKIPDDMLKQLTKISVIPVMSKQYSIYQANDVRC